MTLPEGVHSTRRPVSEQDSRTANRRDWDAYADEYQATHGPFLRDVGFVWGPEGVDEEQVGALGDVRGKRVLAAWLAQLLDAEAACKIGVYLHALAGDLTEADEGEVAMTAGDLAAHLGDAVLELTARRRVSPSNDRS